MSGRTNRLSKGVRAGFGPIHALIMFLGFWAIDSHAQIELPFYSKAEFAHAVAVKAAIEPALLASDGVQGVGIGETNGTLAIAVFVDTTNRIAQLPNDIDGFPVTVQAVGSFHVVPCGGNNSQNTYPLPIPLGISAGNALIFDGGCCASGTIGFKVRDNATGFIGWISNDHVVGHGTDGCPSTAPVGTKQYQPGPIDVLPIGSCGAGQLIGTLNRDRKSVV